MVKRYAWLILFIAVVSLFVIYFKDATGLIGTCLKAMRPVFIAVFFALIFNIPTTFFEKKLFKFKRKKLRRPVSIFTTYLLVAGVFALVLYLLIPQLAESLKGFTKNLPEYATQFEKNINEIISKFGLDNDYMTSIIDKIKSGISESGSKFTEVLPQAFDMVKKTTKGFVDVSIAIVLSIFIISDKERLLSQLWRFIYAITPPKVSKWIKEVAVVSGTVFSKFLSGQLIEAILLGVLTFLGMIIMRLPYPLLVSTVVMISNIIPMLGAYIGGIAGFLIISFISIKQAAIFAIFMIILQQFENNVTYPRVVGNSLGLGGFWILSSVVLGGALLGFWGIMLGVPAVAVIYKIIGRAVEMNPEANGLMPKVLKKSTEKAGDNSTDKRCK